MCVCGEGLKSDPEPKFLASSGGSVEISGRQPPDPPRQIEPLIAIISWLRPATATIFSHVVAIPYHALTVVRKQLIQLKLLSFEAGGIDPILAYDREHPSWGALAM